MRHILRHWRQPTAGALLLVSLAFLGLEMRSRAIYDVLAFTDYARQQRIILSMNETIFLFRWEIADKDNGIDRFDSMPSEEFDFIMADIETLRSRPSFTEIQIPYWCLILPLTLFAGVLLFWERRAKTR
jgi:hypothetical protein